MDGPSGKLAWRHGATQNIPVPNEAANIVGKVIPKLKGMAFCVPTPNVLVMGLTHYLKKSAKHDDIKVVKQVSESLHKGIPGYPGSRHVSYDFHNDT